MLEPKTDKKEILIIKSVHTEPVLPRTGPTTKLVLTRSLIYQTERAVRRSCSVRMDISVGRTSVCHAGDRSSNPRAEKRVAK